ncbi:MAG: hypothetical protein IKV43_04980 [Clostridia bacterium]|nr:hypothetical protein [Clostridia bacterium]
MDFKHVDKKYRPIPFWSWNEKLDPEETRRQVRIMNDAGVGGYFMHARGGLITEYMGDEWFDNVHAACDEGAKLGMHSWAYDENGWPSGFGGGKVNGLGLEYQQKHLYIKKAGTPLLEDEYLVAEKDGYIYYFGVNPYYVDTMNATVTDKFIEEIYVAYEEKCGHTFDGFFTDEPQLWRGLGYPWSLTLEGEFTKRYGYSLVENLDSLFFEKDGCRQVRLDYWQMITDLFSENFFKRIYDWCTEHGYKFTGHLVLEEDFWAQIVPNGVCMPHYEYFSIPGMDWLGRPVFDCLTPMQVSSAAAQTGKKQVLSETFALAGHNVSHAELKRIYEWQMVHGINLLCTHLEGYSLRGIRKRDYPPAMYYQQPWWDDMDIFFDSMSRIGMILAEGKITADTLVLHPQSTAWVLYDGRGFDDSSIDRIQKYSKSFISLLRRIENKHIEYHLGDETLIRRHGRVENGKLIIGEMSYSTIVIPENLGFLPFTNEIVEEFKAQGGKILTVDELPVNPVCEENRLSYTSRTYDDFTFHYFVNTDETPITATINVCNKRMVIETGDLVDFAGGTYEFAPFESLVLIDDGKGRVAPVSKKPTEKLDLSGEWAVKDVTYNSLTLDTCDYYFDGELIEENGYVLNILPRINELRRPVALEQVYRFAIETLPEKLFLAVETPEIFEIEVNGKRIEKTDCGYFRDAAFRLLDIASGVEVGANTIRFRATITQSPETYQHLENSWTFEGMKNCLSYDMEVEPIYIVGDFGVALTDTPEELRLDAYRTHSPLVITAKPATVDIAALDMSGYPEFAGTITLEKTFNLDDTDCHAVLVGRGINSIHLSVNGKEVATVMNPPYEVDLSDYLVKGENTVTLTFINNLRNMMGPHHWMDGELLAVAPSSFYLESNVFFHFDGANESNHEKILKYWNDGTCLVHYGLKVD